MKRNLMSVMFALVSLIQCFSYDYKEINHIKCEKFTDENHNMISESTLSFIKQQRGIFNDFPEIKETDYQFEIFIIFNELAANNRIICAFEKNIFDSTWYIIIHEILEPYRSQSGIHILDIGTLQGTEKNTSFSYLDSIFDNPEIPSTEGWYSAVETKTKKQLRSPLEWFLSISLLIVIMISIFINTMIKRKFSSN